MPKMTKDAVSDRLFETASLWHARMQRKPDMSAKDMEEMLHWLDDDPRHRAAYEEAARLWDALHGPAQALADDEEKLAQGYPVRGTGQKPARMSGVTLARFGFASCLLSFIAVCIWLMAGGVDYLRSDYVTRAGELEQVMLDDGSSMTLNTGSAASVDIGSAGRNVRLFRGEAFFNVKPDAARPFAVTTADGIVTVVGTAFNVRIEKDRTIVSLVSGKVHLTPLRGADAGRTTSLAPGRQAYMGGVGLGPVSAFDKAEVTAWQRRQIVFYRTPLRQVVDELNRYQSGRIIILRQGIGDLQVTGVFNVADTDAAVDIIEQTLGVRAIRLAGLVTVLR